MSCPVYVIDNMYNGGTTTSLRSVIVNKESMNEYHIFNDKNTIDELNCLLRSINKKRLFPRKDSGIRIALFYYDANNKRHELVIIGDKEYGAYRIMDLSMRVEYLCKTRQEKELLEELIQKIETN